MFKWILLFLGVGLVLLMGSCGNAKRLDLLEDTGGRCCQFSSVEEYNRWNAEILQKHKTALEPLNATTWVPSQKKDGPLDVRVQPGASKQTSGFGLSTDSPGSKEAFDSFIGRAIDRIEDSKK